jgi:hypothetical protein
MFNMPAQHRPRLSRRDLLKGSATAGAALVIATHVPLPPLAQNAAAAPMAPMPNAFIRIAPDNTVTVIIKHLDKGQGVTTGLSTIVAEELDADWAQMRAEFAPADAALYSNLIFHLQGTGGSTSVANSWMQLRLAAAAAREMLVAAAAAEWKVAASEITVEKGVVEHKPSGRTARFGSLAAQASTLPVPQNPRLKDPASFRLIGSRDVKRLDTPAKITGKTFYAMDVKRPNMVYAVLARTQIRRHHKIFRRVRGQGGPGRGRRGAGADGRRRSRSDDMGGETRPRRAEDRLGFLQSGDALHRRHRRRLQEAGRRGRIDRNGQRRCRKSAGLCREGHRGGIRVPVSRSCAHGAAQLRGRADSRWL